MIRVASAGLIVAASGALAQDVAFSPSQTEACLAGAGDMAQMRACIGQSAQACMVNTEGGETTVGMSGCFDREWQYWDVRLNAAYQQKLAEAKAMDAEMADLGATVPSQADALREMQRAWIPYRDALCGYEMSQWGGGTGGGPAITACLMTETAEQTLYLENAGLGE